jgi:hypothetical protein
VKLTPRPGVLHNRSEAASAAAQLKTNPLGPSSWSIANVEERYAVLNGKRIGTMHLDSRPLRIPVHRVPSA